METSLIPHPASDIDRILGLAITSNVTVETIERIVALKERMEDRAAAAEFNAALAAFQGACPPIRKGSTAKIATRSGGQFSYTYASLDRIAEVVRPVLKEHGLSYSWDSEMADTKVVCKCIVRHIAGHSQSAHFTCPTESDSAMSAQQRHASALKYAMRQSLVQALGLTTTDSDTDASTTEKLTPDQVAEIDALIIEAKADRVAVLKYAKADTVETIAARDYSKIKTALVAKIAEAAKVKS